MKVRVKVRRTVVPVFFAIDDKYTKYLAVSLKSLMANANVKNYKYDIHILNGGITEVTKGLISDLIEEPKNFRVYFDDVREYTEKSPLGNQLALFTDMRQWIYISNEMRG